MTIVVSAVVFLFRRLLGALLSLLGSGIFSRSIHGSWKVELKKDGRKISTEYATTKQVLHWVWGKIDVPADNKTYTFKGTFRSNVLVATYRIAKTPTAVDVGAFAIAVNPFGEGRRMGGACAWTDDEGKVPQCADYEWELRRQPG